MNWIYIFGERGGADLKVGRTTGAVAAGRLDQVNGEQTTEESYVCLAAVLGTQAEEKAIKRHFAEFRRPKGRRTEYFEPTPALVEYAAWLRSQYFASPDGTDRQEDWIIVEPDVWLPDGEARRMPHPEHDHGKIVQDFETFHGPLAGTPWSWFPDPKVSIQDYFTPPELIDAVREGMGGIDLDAASHWLANRTLKIPRYFHRGFSAFEHDWEGRVWLNPPFGDNDPWWKRVVEFVEAGKIEQICIVSPVWAFTTHQAEPLMRHVAATVLLTPTPKWWGNPNEKVGSNHPHAIVYIGPRVAEVLAALEPWGIPMELAWRGT